MAPAESRGRPGGVLLWRLWAPAVCIALLVAVVGVGIARAWSFYGYALVLGVPLLAGVIVGFAVHLRAAIKVCLLFLLLGSIVLVVLVGNLAGIFCAIIMAALILGPLAVGVLLGHLYRRQIDLYRHSRPRVTVALVVLLNPVTLTALEQQLPGIAGEQTVRTERRLAASPAQVWQALVFYEDVPLEPPTLAVIGLPHPVGTEGIPDRVGRQTTCRYSTGHLTKRVRVYRPERLLAFDVIEQNGVEDRSIRLTGGSFRLVAEGSGTRLILSTRYVPLLEARLLWQPFEHRLAQMLHNHVLDGVELNLDGSEP